MLNIQQISTYCVPKETEPLVYRAMNKETWEGFVQHQATDPESLNANKCDKQIGKHKRWIWSKVFDRNTVYAASANLWRAAASLIRISGASVDTWQDSEDFSLLWSKAKAGRQKVQSALWCNVIHMWDWESEIWRNLPRVPYDQFQKHDKQQDRLISVQRNRLHLLLVGLQSSIWRGRDSTRSRVSRYQKLPCNGISKHCHGIHRKISTEEHRIQ